MVGVAAASGATSLDDATSLGASAVGVTSTAGVVSAVRTTPGGEVSSRSRCAAVGGAGGLGADTGASPAICRDTGPAVGVTGGRASGGPIGATGRRLPRAGPGVVG
jgi:hypothetical protein